jgi:hypothetical protein
LFSEASLPGEAASETFTERFGDSRPAKKFLGDRFGDWELLSPVVVAVDSCLSIRDCRRIKKLLEDRFIDFSALFSVLLFFGPDSCFELGLRES